jgi:glutamine amidotransferase
MVSVAIFDYGAGNIFSLKNSLEKAGASVDVITNFDEPNKYSGLLLPGVGNFDPAINSIRNYSKTEFQDYVKDMPVLGICLGMEMFFEKSEEGKENGLNVIDGEVIILPPTLKVPHMGWNDLEIKKPGKILEGVDDGSWVYFVHSYRAKPSSDDVVTAVSDYGIKVPALFER